jgi:hypothetical protein
MIAEDPTIHARYGIAADLFFGGMFHIESLRLAGDFRESVLPTRQDDRMPTLELGSQLLENPFARCFLRFLTCCTENSKDMSEADWHESSSALLDRGSGQDQVEARCQEAQSQPGPYQNHFLLLQQHRRREIIDAASVCINVKTSAQIVGACLGIVALPSCGFFRELFRFLMRTDCPRTIVVQILFSSNLEDCS